MIKTINALVIALFFTFATAFVQAGGDMHEPGYKCTNQPECSQSQAAGAGSTNELNTSSSSNSTAVASALVQLVITLIPKG